MANLVFDSFIYSPNCTFTHSSQKWLGTTFPRKPFLPCPPVTCSNFLRRWLLWSWFGLASPHHSHFWHQHLSFLKCQSGGSCPTHSHDPGLANQHCIRHVCSHCDWLRADHGTQLQDLDGNSRGGISGLLTRAAGEKDDAGLGPLGVGSW